MAVSFQVDSIANDFAGWFPANLYVLAQPIDELNPEWMQKFYAGDGHLISLILFVIGVVLIFNLYLADSCLSRIYLVECRCREAEIYYPLGYRPPYPEPNCIRPQRLFALKKPNTSGENAMEESEQGLQHQPIRQKVNNMVEYRSDNEKKLHSSAKEKKRCKKGKRRYKFNVLVGKPNNNTNQKKNIVTTDDKRVGKFFEGVKSEPEKRT